MKINDTKLEQKITFKYASALAFIALLSTVSFYILYKSIDSSSFTAYLVNTSGKQRMLSQNIALDLHKIHQNLQERNNMSHIKDTLMQELSLHMKEILVINESLSKGKLPNGHTVSLSPMIYEMYFGAMDLRRRVHDYVKVAKPILNFKSHLDVDFILKKVDAKSTQLLVDLNKLVHQYEIEGEEKLHNLKMLAAAAWVMVIITLLLEVIFLFQPILKKLIVLVDQNKHTLQNLEREVELRTLKLKEANSSLQDMVSRDPMTGLKNRLTLESDIEQAIHHNKDNHAPFSILMFDIDWFKEVNDTYGHDIGDIVIKEVSNIFSLSVREEDKVYRAGGEEFVILLNRISLEDTEKIAEKIRILIEKKIFKADDIEFHKTISAGLYHSSITDAKSIFHVLKIVDNALYEAKQNGRNRVVNIL